MFNRNFLQNSHIDITRVLCMITTKKGVGFFHILSPSGVASVENDGNYRSSEYAEKNGQLSSQSQAFIFLQIFRNWRQLTQGLSQGYPMKYHAISAALIVVAIFLELAGVGKAASDLGASLFTAGCACEFWFWIRLRLVRKSRRHETTST